MDLVGSGRNADVFAVGEGRVLRRYRDGGDVAAEAAVMAHVTAFGYPVPRVHHADGRPPSTRGLGCSPTSTSACTPCRRGAVAIPTRPCCTWTCIRAT